jgi:hypothetical protein
MIKFPKKWQYLALRLYVRIVAICRNFALGSWGFYIYLRSNAMKMTNDELKKEILSLENQLESRNDLIKTFLRLNKVLCDELTFCHEQLLCEQKLRKK